MSNQRRSFQERIFGRSLEPLEEATIAIFGVAIAFVLVETIFVVLIK